MPVLLEFMKNQSQAKGFLGLHLVAGLIIFIAMSLTLGEISEDISNREPLTLTDAQFSTWLHSHTQPLLTSAMFVVTSLGSSVFVSCIAVVFGLYLIWRRRFYWLAAFVSSVYGGMLLNKILKYLFQRPRPHFDDPLLSLTSYSFPSGHTMTATVVYGVLAAYLFSTTHDWRRRVVIFFVASFLILLVGFSRIYLGAHYLSDVLGAMAEGLAWLSFCLTVVYSVWRRRQ
ncbi:MAG TPA: phosphatase PAP2 family protein [Pyrinomonadaceae bacterium]|nr:phosphatase PAP2 family protein [Pyrinomonadaceae bacterium]